MKRYEIELRGPSLQTNLTLILLRFGKTVRLSLQTTRLPEPYVSCDPQTGEPVVRLYIQAEELTDQQVASFCQQFQAANQQCLYCCYRHTQSTPNSSNNNDDKLMSAFTAIRV